jgi:tRNA/tmRNA/rRNA uracil-C5-methylase (TrmA/RlmC/RlmD family)
MKKRRRNQQGKEEKSWVSQLLSLLFSHSDLHVPSKKLKHYRNKITYNLPLESVSPLAELHLNEVCQAIDDWTREREVIGLFREVMAKSSRDNSMMIRVTVQRRQRQEDNHDIVGANADVKEDTDTAGSITCGKEDLDDYDYDDWDDSAKQAFVSHLTQIFPSITCICYNESLDRSRPTKDAPLKLIYGNEMHVLEKTPSGLSYQISPDSFCEINHEVEDLQNEQTVSWIQQYQGAILVCSGRDINSYGLGLGSIKNAKGGKVFSEVVAVNHCPLVAKDAKANFERHKDEIKATVLHLSKNEMAKGVSVALEAARERQNYPPVVVVTTGGRKGLDQTYLNFLKDYQAVECIVYNSCSTKSLEVDMEGFVSGPQGYLIDDFRSYDFFAGTKYSASVLRLLRRPKTLVLPVGPAGCGKSTLASTLTERSPRNTCLWWHRDLEFAKLRNANVSMTKSKSLIHGRMLSFLNGDCKSVRIVDSTNGNAGARLLYFNESRPEIFIIVVLSPPTKDGENVIEMLLERTSNRLAGGKTSHPSFPSTVHEQREKHLAILKGIEYPSRVEVTTLSKECKRTIILHCDPFNLPKVSSLPFEIFMLFSASASLNDILGVAKSTYTTECT